MIGTLRLLSINVGLPVEVQWDGRTIRTSIFKNPVKGNVRINRLNISGDRQADPAVHGGRDKAVYGYAAEHYEFWKNEYGVNTNGWGAFGENLTISGGLFEDEICIGDRFRLGTSELIAVQPRLPCFKLGIRFSDREMVKRFQKAERYGIYFRVARQGTAGTGDSLTPVFREEIRMSILDLGRLLTTGGGDRVLMERAIGINSLPDRIRARFEAYLQDH